MTKITTQSQFIKWISQSDTDFEKSKYDHNNYYVGSSMLIIKDMELDELDIDGKSFVSTKFSDCIFKNIDFKSVVFHSCILKNCTFDNCEFYWSKFLESDLIECKFDWCTIADLELGDTVIKNSKFINCPEILDLRMRGFGAIRIVEFQNSYLHHLDIEPMQEDFDEQFKFYDCIIKESSFDRTSLVNECFENCNLALNQFSSCILSKNSFIGKNEIPGKEYNLIDIRTILNSEPIEQDILENIFGIHNSEIKEYLIDLTSKIEFQSIFISYSFKDKDFAKNLDETLRRRGVLTFLWENDSPGGKTLESIMSSNVKEKDRVLFIASKDSLKSKACHYELSQGRQKQELIWEDVLFQIHIDNYLFELEKSKIRPENVQEEYWSNIEELRKLNSLDFSKFVNSKERDGREFEKLIFRLIKGLRKEK